VFLRLERLLDAPLYLDRVRSRRRRIVDQLGGER
jgi:hypothetical protein